MSLYYFIEKNFIGKKGMLLPQPQTSYQRLSKSKNPVRTLGFLANLRTAPQTEICLYLLP